MSSRVFNAFTPAFKAAIDTASRRIFGNLPITNTRTGFKVLQRKPIGPLAINYYPADAERPFRNTLDDFATDLERRRVEALYRLKRRGKGPAKKGQGKRASKKK
jgi:small subunit ribosomal protein S33